MNSRSAVISCAGLISSVGMGAEESAASVRVGFNRFSQINGTAQFDDEELEAPLTGAAVNMLTRGFVQQATWVVLARNALCDLVSKAKFPNASEESFWKNTALIWVLPEITYERFLWPDSEVNRLLSECLTDQLSEITGIPLCVPEQGYFLEGSAGVGRALRAMINTISEGHFERAIVLCVDSLLDPHYLNLQLGGSKIKEESNPVGYIPGEAAGCFLVESCSSAQNRDVYPVVIPLCSSYKKYEPVNNIDQNSLSELDSSSGGLSEWYTNNIQEIARQIVDVIKQTLASSLSTPFIGDIYLDLNGEEWRSCIWGAAQVRLTQLKIIDFERCREIIPAFSWGNIGAASGGSAIALIEQSYIRGYSLSDMSLVITVSENANLSSQLFGRESRVGCVDQTNTMES